MPKKVGHKSAELFPIRVWQMAPALSRWSKSTNVSYLNYKPTVAFGTTFVALPIHPQVVGASRSTVCVTRHGLYQCRKFFEVGVNGDDFLPQQWIEGIKS